VVSGAIGSRPESIAGGMLSRSTLGVGANPPAATV